ncbi:MAG: sugar transferase [Alloprevotella sp.]|nr:sugar transferase [Alloprevotella sp.]
MMVRTVNRQQDGQSVTCRLQPWQRGLKRAADAACAALGVVLTSPLLIVIALALKVQGKGSVIYAQERIGLGGRPFNILKFRTMVPNAEPDGKPQLQQENDTRLTPVGSFLRRHHLDELPQLWNVLRGDMSLVGYRPERQYFIDMIMAEDPRYACLYQMRPGVTSEATLYNGYTDTMEKMLERLSMDLRYMETASLGRDLSIILSTLGRVVKGEKKK